MRAAILGLTASLLTGNALAADYLRGSNYEPPGEAYRWSGFYVGGQVGYSEANARFGPTARAPRDPLRQTIESAAQLAEWVALPGASARGMTYGGFVGYNAQWGDVVLGLEANYSHMALRAASRGITLPQGGGLVDYGGFARVTDVATFRARAGYAMGWLMPYAFVGLAIGRVDTVRTATISFPTPPDPFPPYTDVDTHNGNFAVGFATGAGLDIGLTQNIFLRGEYEFVHLTNVRGVTAIMNTVRAGAGVKF